MKKGISLSQRLKLREENSWCSQWWWTSFVWIPSNRNKIVFLSCWFLLLRLEMIRLVLSHRSWEILVVLPFLFHWWNLSASWSDSITFFDIVWKQLWNIKCKTNISTWWKCLVSRQDRIFQSKFKCNDNYITSSLFRRLLRKLIQRYKCTSKYNELGLLIVVIWYSSLCLHIENFIRILFHLNM